MTAVELYRLLKGEDVPSDAEILVEDGEGHLVGVKNLTVTTVKEIDSKGDIKIVSKAVLK